MRKNEDEKRQLAPVANSIRMKKNQNNIHKRTAHFDRKALTGSCPDSQLVYWKQLQGTTVIITVWKNCLKKFSHLLTHYIHSVV